MFLAPPLIVEPLPMIVMELNPFEFQVEAELIFNFSLKIIRKPVVKFANFESSLSCLNHKPFDLYSLKNS